MIIYPAVDIKDGKCVRLIQGRFDNVTSYSDNPVDMAFEWESMGAEYLHVVDLDGARKGIPVNYKTIENIVSRLQIPVQMGGGIRSVQTIENMLDMGINRVIIGTSAVNQPGFAREVFKLYSSKIAVGIDSKEGKVAIEGWEKTSETEAVEFAKKMEKAGACTIIYTDIARDGMLKGPNFDAMKEMADEVDIDVIASGGVSSLNDIKKLKQTGVSGVIIGKALYTGDINLKHAIETVKQEIKNIQEG